MSEDTCAQAMPYQDQPSVIGRRISYQNDGKGCTMTAGKLEQRE
jgi:hypothetical protein